MFNGKELAEIKEQLAHLICHTHELKTQVHELTSLVHSINDASVIAMLTKRLKGVRYSLMDAITTATEKTT